jgi:hypothetical protein
LKRKTLIAISAVLIASAVSASLLIWNFYRYETSVLSLGYVTNPVMSSPLTDANYTWEVRAYSMRIFGNSPFDGQGYAHRERIMSENRFGYADFHSLNASLRLRFQITNSTGYLLCNETLQTSDGCDREMIFEFKPELARVGSTIQIRIALSLNVRYEYGAGRESMQFSIEKEWTKMIQIQQTEPAVGEQF